ncbi:hypothetical protein LI328DRAFT_167485 [Trichoderma asperelloides]|nr:hypothetical protein LI328DRAFT_167485 [Trichoderma asperelloides]
MSDNLNSQTLSSFTTFTKEDFLARAVAAQDQLRQQNPDLIEDELDLKLSTGRWEKAFMLPAATEKFVPKDVNNELQAACGEFAAANYSRKALDRFRAKTHTVLAGHQEALQLIETIILKSSKVWDQMHEHVLSKQNAENTNS